MINYNTSHLQHLIGTRHHLWLTTNLCLYLDIFEMLCWLLLLRHREILHHVKPYFPVFFWKSTTNTAAMRTNRISLSLSHTHTHTLNAHSNISSFPICLHGIVFDKVWGQLHFYLKYESALDIQADNLVCPKIFMNTVLSVANTSSYWQLYEASVSNGRDT